MSATIIGAISIFVGFALIFSSINPLVEVRASWKLFRIMKKVWKEESKTKKPSKMKTFIVYVWHYSGYLIVSFGASIIGSQINSMF